MLKYYYYEIDRAWGGGGGEEHELNYALGGQRLHERRPRGRRIRVVVSPTGRRTGRKGTRHNHARLLGLCLTQCLSVCIEACLCRNRFRQQGLGRYDSVAAPLENCGNTKKEFNNIGEACSCMCAVVGAVLCGGALRELLLSGFVGRAADGSA